MDSFGKATIDAETNLLINRRTAKVCLNIAELYAEAKDKKINGIIQPDGSYEYTFLDKTPAPHCQFCKEREGIFMDTEEKGRTQYIELEGDCTLVLCEDYPYRPISKIMIYFCPICGRQLAEV